MSPIETIIFIIKNLNMKTHHNFIDYELYINACNIVCNRCKFKTSINLNNINCSELINDCEYLIQEDVMTCDKHVIKNIIE